MNRNLLVAGGIIVVALIVLFIAAPWRSRPGQDEARNGTERTGRTDGLRTPHDGSASTGGESGPATDGGGQPPAESDLQHRLPAGTVAGQVVDQASQPIELAKVVVLVTHHAKEHDEAGKETAVKHNDLFERVVETDSRGRFEITGVPDEKLVPLNEAGQLDECVTCILLAQKDGYRMARQDVVPGGYELRLVLEETAAVVSGRVIARDTREPLPKARVLCRPGETETTTDADGAFRLKVPVSFEPPESIAVSVICYPREADYAPQELPNVTVVQGRQVGDLLFELDHGTLVLRGEILDSETRERLPGMGVRIHEYDPYQYYYFPEGSRAELAVDAPDGTFEFDRLRPGTFQIEAVRKDWNCTLARYQETLEEGEGPKELKIYVSTGGSRIVTGTVTGPSGEPLENAAVWLIQRVQPMGAGIGGAEGAAPPPTSLLMYQPTATDAAGRYGFQLYFDPAQQKVGAMALSPGCELTFAWLGDGDQQVLELDLALRHGARVAGTITDDAGAPLKNATVTIDGETLGPPFYASFSSLPNPRGAVTTVADGTYEFAYLLPGDYVVSVEHKDFAFRQEAVSAAQGADCRLDLALQRGQTIRGTVYDEQGQPLYVHSVVAVSRRWREYDSTVTNADGTFTLRRIPSGEPVTVLVLEDRVNLQTAKSFYYAAVEGVSPGRDDLVIVAKEMKFGSVEIQVVDAATGDPVTTYEVWCSRQPQPGLNGLARTFYYRPNYGRASVGVRQTPGDEMPAADATSGNEEGRVTLSGLLPGPHEFYVNADGYNTKVSDTVRVESGGTSTVRVELERSVGPGMGGVPNLP